LHDHPHKTADLTEVMCDFAVAHLRRERGRRKVSINLHAPRRQLLALQDT